MPPLTPFTAATPAAPVRLGSVHPLLDPKLDVIFKLLFSHERNRNLLVSLLTAVLDPPEPITEVRVLNPEISREAVQDKGAVLDVRVKLQDGRQINVEMQSQPHPGLLKRALLYLARLYTSQLGRGDPYQDLAPAVSVFVLNFNQLPTARYHTSFRLLETQDHWTPTDDVTLHFVELPKLPDVPVAPDGPALWKWGRLSETS